MAKKKKINQYLRAKEIRDIYGFYVRVFDFHIRVSDGDKILDIYRTKWHDLKTQKRGIFVDYEKLIFKHFLT